MPALNGDRSRSKMRAYRERMRAKGLRPVQVWVPDTRSAAFRQEAHRQSAAVAASALAAEDQAFIDAVSDLGAP
ncbi:antitoxin MazE family protein [Magnetospirillum sp. UT-4]|uniref:antitoxin MazE family protein n=1 Tax=Magnetospirillum sp. UT-4 TaxID=2681467 RepID=UPI0013826EBD|nr:antitoxin MazE family protein [Magnetospirillum sp. UT-4]CAA7627159.1 Antitoxin MazE [Magnetospirillum sp. UT-4]